MKIGFLTSYRAQDSKDKEYGKILAFLEKKGHEVVHHLDTNLSQLLPLGYAEREAIFMDFYKRLEECELVFVDCPVQSTQLGFGIAYLRSKGKPVVILTPKGTPLEFFPQGDIYSEIENMAVYQYDEKSIDEVLEEALEYMEPRIDKRFTIIFPSFLLAKIEEKAQKLHLPKAVYIRQLIEKDIKEN